MDIINHFVEIEQGSALDLLRDQRPEAKEHAQKAFLALFAPENTNGVTLEERFAIAYFTAALHGEEKIAAFYCRGLEFAGASQPLIQATDQAAKLNLRMGPYGSYPKGPLSGEDIPGPVFYAPREVHEQLGLRLSAALSHAHLLVYHPRDSNTESLQQIFNAGWSEDAVVTISQLITFLAYQIRLIYGLRVMTRCSEV